MAGELSRRDLLRQAKGVALTAPFLGLTACDGLSDRRRGMALAGPTMGTAYHVTITDGGATFSRPGEGSRELKGSEKKALASALRNQIDDGGGGVPVGELRYARARLLAGPTGW